MIVVVAGLAVTAAAFGQPGEGRRGGRGGWGGGEFLREIGRQMRGDPLRARDVERAAELVGMTEDQKSAAKTLLEGYEQQLRTMREEQQAQREEAMEAMRDAGDTSGFQAMRDAQAKQREKQSQRETQLLGDMKALLKPEQAEKWTGVEASIRRDQRLRRGLMSGERLNVRDIVHDLKLDGEAASAVDGVLQQYDVEIDRQLAARDQLMDQPLPEFRGFQDPDAMEAMQKRMTERREASTKVRDVNKRFATQVEGVLPDAQREAFRARVQEGTYPEIFRRTSGGEAIAKAMAMPDLSPEQMEQVVRIEEDYRAKLGAWRPRAVKAWDEMETQMTPDRMMGGGARDALRPVGELRGQRRDLDRATLEELKKVLTEDQAKELPELERDEGGGGGGGGGRRRMPRDV
jgi:hypothetical protein